LPDTDFPPGDFDFAGARVEQSKSGREIVTVMDAAEPRRRNDFVVRARIVRCLPAGGCVLCQCEVRPVVMVIANELVHQAFQMALVEHDYVVKQIMTAGADPAFGHAVLPGASDRGADWAYAQAFHGFQDLAMECVLAIKDQIPWRGIERKGLARV